MRISISVYDQNQIVTQGYGQATYQMVMAMQRLGFSVRHEDPTAQVEFCFSQPYLWRWFNPDSYKIGMSAWESTRIPDTWRAGLRTCDEFWTPSPVMAELFANQGYPAKVWEHGVDTNVWKLNPRKRGDKIRFLHMGEPALRKGGQMTYYLFRQAFGNSEHASLTIKAHHLNTIRGHGGLHPDQELNNVTVITDDMSEASLVRLFQDHDVLVYPSWGEGFGLIPLQAMATGMPVICTGAWAPYSDLLHPDLRLASRLVKSPWSEHTGQMWEPSYHDLYRAMDSVFKNYNQHAAYAADKAEQIVDRYNWDRLTAEAWAPIVKRFD